MNKSAKTWLLFMMIPFFIGVIVYFLVPLLIIVASNPKLEGTFNGYKIQVEQNTVRALSFLNSRVTTNRMQMYRNVMSTFVKLIIRNDIRNLINITEINLNNAYQIANLNSSANFNSKRSMWYSSNTSSIQEMSNEAKGIYTSYLQAQPYIQYVFHNQDQIYSTISQIFTMVNQSDTHFYFQYPSQKKQQFKTPYGQALNKYYSDTIKNMQLSQLKMTVFDLGKHERICSVFNFIKGSQLNGVTCIDLEISVFVKDVTMVVNQPQFELSTNDYYYLRPLYDFQKLENPIIIANFSSRNLDQISIPSNTYLSLSENNLEKKLFYTNYTYTMNIQRLQRTKTYYTTPIVTTNDDNTNDTLLYSIVLNNFANAELSQQSKSSRIAVIMVVPSVVLLLISILVTTCILKSIFRKLDEALGLMENYCSLIKRGDLQLQIPEYTESEDLKQMFGQLSKLNQLNKYCDYSYFNVPKPERIIRLLKCRKMFIDLNYDKTNLYENICECYVEIGDMAKALQFMKNSINMTIKDIYGSQEQIQRIYEAKLNKKIKIDKSTKKKQIILRRKMLRLCQLLYVTHQEQQNKLQIETQIIKTSQLLRKITYPDILNFQYIGSFMFIINFQISNNDFAKIQKNLQTLYELLRGYEQVYENSQEGGTPPQIMYSYWHLIVVNLKMAQKKYLQAFEHCVKCLQGNKFNPVVHTPANMILQKILQINKLDTQQLRHFKYLEQYNPRGNREYIFLIDVSKPQMSIKEVNQWKKKARTMGEHILDEYVDDNDRVSITQFCQDIKVICNLVEKQNRDKILKKELKSSIKARQQTTIGYFAECLQKSIQRVKGLKNQKIFIMFLKGKLQLNVNQLCKQVMNIQNSKLILLVQTRTVIKQKNQNCLAFQYDQLEDIGRVLGSKTLKQADNIVYIF